MSEGFANDQALRDALRKPFPAEQIGKLPKPLQKNAEKKKCGGCGGYHGVPAIHLDYVGHGAVTDRLNTVAPDWTFTIDHRAEYVGKDGQPHVAGIVGTMLLGDKAITETGDVDRPSTWGNEMKNAISDFIRRAAMRFGVALDLWSKEDLDSNRETAGGDGSLPTAPPSSPPSSGGAAREDAAPPEPSEPPEFVIDGHEPLKDCTFKAGVCEVCGRSPREAKEAAA